jgi:diguanylate cyclase (GGDEF)-like protein/putative nucleotidyltransferase with HDIG domain
LKNQPLRARAFIILTIAVGFATMLYGLQHWGPTEPLRFLVYLVCALVAAGLKVRLPGITATMSVNFLFVLLGTVELGFSETLLIGCGATLLQCFWRTKHRPTLAQILFNVSSMAIAVAASYSAFVWMQREPFPDNVPVLLMVSAAVLFLVNTLSVSVVVALTEGKSIRQIWSECYFWSFPYYLGGAAIAWLASHVNKSLGWQTTVAILPVVYWVYRSYRAYLDRLEEQRKHAQDMASLHLRTIEALALAIDAKDHTTHDHLRRVRVYATEIGREIGLSDSELDAIRAAALLHDIGKLAVPEHILSKPGRLTPEEFEKVKIHPIVGAEILERVEFPYAVVPIVRSHHEKWDGSGYPDGLSGEAIPIGARILSVVDSLDALASPRQYRPALPLDEAMKLIVAEAGRSFDPRIVEVLKRRYVGLEQMARSERVSLTKLSTEAKVSRGLAPAAGFESSPASSRDLISSEPCDFLSSIAGARQEVQMLFELSQTLGNSLSLDETLSVLALRLQRLMRFDTIAVFIRNGETLHPRYVSGENFQIFSSLRIPVGSGLIGWVALNEKPILNGDPMVEPGYMGHPDQVTHLRSALAVPLVGLEGVVGVMVLYRAEACSFTKDHQRVLQAISSKVALAVDNAMKYQLAANSATTDYLTGLPNARSLFMHMDAELARCRRSNEPLTVLVCDLNGFKGINDKHGHLEGNRVLKMVARGFKEACREYDFVARMGGDEFVVVAPGLPPAAISELLKRLRNVAVEAGLATGGRSLLSVSIGQASFPEDGTDAEGLLSEADRRMYVAKQQHHSAFATHPSSNVTDLNYARVN